MRILLKCPTRSRPQKVIPTLRSYVSLASRKDLIGVAVSCDEDDTSMTRHIIQQELHDVLAPLAWHRLFYSSNSSKIQACNANMSEIDYPWDIVVLVSDDMIPQIHGWDDVIRTYMKANFPTTDGILWFNDGYQKDNLNTLSIYGRKMYESLGYLYAPEYKSFYCDTELTDLCKGPLAAKCRYIPYCIIRHEHPGTGYQERMDALYAKNQLHWNEDMTTYAQRKTYPYDWSALIPTIPGREVALHRLLESLHEKIARLCPQMRYEVCVAFDNREDSIGMKRQKLLDQATGKYLAFIDDDDAITDAYIEDLWACIQGGFHTMRLWGEMAEYRFVHSTEITTESPMATHDDPAVFQRPPNHLNPMLSVLAKSVSFKNAVHGEDLDWTLNLYRRRLLQTEYRSDPSRTHYIYNLGPRSVHPDVVKMQRTTTYDAMLGMIFTPAGAQMIPATPAATPGLRTLRLGRTGFVSK